MESFTFLLRRMWGSKHREVKNRVHRYSCVDLLDPKTPKISRACMVSEKLIEPQPLYYANLLCPILFQLHFLASFPFHHIHRHTRAHETRARQARIPPPLVPCHLDTCTPLHDAPNYATPLPVPTVFCSLHHSGNQFVPLIACGAMVSKMRECRLRPAQFPPTSLGSTSLFLPRFYACCA